MKRKLLFILGFTTCFLSSEAQVEISSGGTPTEYTLTIPGAFTLKAGIQITFKANIACAAAVTMNVNGTLPKTIKKEGGATDLVSGDIIANQVVNLVYDGTYWQMLSASGIALASANSVWSLKGNTGINVATNFLGTTDALPLLFRTNNTERMRINASGNIGIGTNTPTERLSVVDTGAQAMLGIDGTANTGIKFKTSGSENWAQYYNNAQQGMFFYSNALLGAPLVLKDSGSIGMGTIAPNASALLDLTSTSKGVLVPRMTLAQRNAISTPATGLLVYNTGSDKFNYYNGTAWKVFDVIPANPDWSTVGNSGTNPATDYIGTSDAQDLVFKTSDVQRMRINTTGKIGINGTTPNAKYDLYNESPIADFGPDHTGILSYRDGSNVPANGGTGWGETVVDAAIKGASNWGNNYSVAVAGYNYQDFPNSAGVIGSDWNATIFGALSYKDASSIQWGVYTPNNTFIGGNLTMPTGAAANYILKSDATGLASWADPNSVGPWTKSGSNIFQTTLTDNVGIGTNTPSALFSVGSGASSPFQVNSSGNIIKLNGAATTFPAANTSGFLSNNGSGTLTWSTAGILSGGVINTIPKWTAANALGNSSITDNGTTITMTQAAASFPQVVHVSNTASAYGGNINLMTGVPVAGAGGTLGMLGFGANGGMYDEAAIRGMRDAASGGGADLPTALVFYTTKDATAANAERMRIDNAGNVGIGISTPLSKLNVAGISQYEAAFLLQNFAANNTEPRIMMTKSRNPAIGSNTIVNLNDITGQIGGWGADGASSTSYWPTGTIEFEVDGTPGINNMPGRITFNTTPSGTNIQSEKMRITNAGFVGIGTTAPPANLTIHNPNDANIALSTQGAAAGDDIAFNLVTLNNAAGSLQMGAVSTKGWAFGARGNAWATVAERNMAYLAYFDGASWIQPLNYLPNGNVGIATAAPSQKLHIFQSTGSPKLLIESNGAGATDAPGIILDANGQNTGNSTITFNENGVYKASTGWSTTSTQQYWFVYDGGTGQNIVYKAGDFGIGTNAPASKLSMVSLAADGAGTFSNGLTFLNNSWGHAGIWSDGYAGYNGDMIFGTDGDGVSNVNITEKMRIKGNGNVGIGTNNPTELLTISSNTSGFISQTIKNYSSFALGTSLAFQKGRGTATAPLAVASGDDLGAIDFFGYNSANASMQWGATIYAEASQAFTTSAYAGSRLVFSTAPLNTNTPTERMTILNNGNIGMGTSAPGTHRLSVVGTAGLSTGTAWTNTSDIRLKDVRSNYEYGLKEIIQLRTIRFNYKKDNVLGLPSDKEIIGFVAQEVQVVIPDAINVRPDGYLELNADPIHWAAINAIKELNVKVESQQKQIESLKAENGNKDEEINKIKSDNAVMKAEIEKIRTVLGLEAKARK
ncbi:MAG: hypothetical protein A3F72_02395 [Bacteroidetes bacterium RIFCSPLOWO2_12_FULL_35_15]|nr:MAG: hypothetical protein A3F72_02395 [Bacteroidetes bacterium RIFCSPLOWO2_12_FULL_35_15]